MNDTETMRDAAQTARAAADTIDRLIAENAALKEAQRWIPVSELPKADGQYLCSDCAYKSGYMRVLNYAANSAKVDTYDITMCGSGAGFYDWDDETGFYCVTSVSHWMPLPEPPKADKGDT